MEHPPRQRVIDEITINDLLDAKREAENAATSVQLQFDNLLRAARLANEGHLAEARREITLCIDSLHDPRALFLAFQFFFRTGDLEAAESVTRRRIEIARKPGYSWALARACSNLALILANRGRLPEAREAAEQAVALNKSSSNQRDYARDLGTLAYVLEALKNDAEAERLYIEALAIAERLNAADLIATQLANLGDIALRKGEHARARELWTRALPLLSAAGKHQFASETSAKLAAIAIA